MLDLSSLDDPSTREGWMRRRAFIAALGSAAAWPLMGHAQQRERVRRIGVVMAYAQTDPNGQMQVAAFRQQLQKLGWLEGNNLQIDFRYAADDPARIRALAVELLGMSPDLPTSNLRWEVNGSRCCGRSRRKLIALVSCCTLNHQTSATGNRPRPLRHRSTSNWLPWR